MAAVNRYFVDSYTVSNMSVIYDFTVNPLLSPPGGLFF